MIRIALLLLTTLSLHARNETVAYLVGDAQPDPFYWELPIAYHHLNDDPSGGKRPDKFPKAEAAKFPSRFLKKEHQLWEITRDLKAMKYLDSKNSWAILNTTTRRLVIHTSFQDHIRLRDLTTSLLPLRECQQTIEFFTAKSDDLRHTSWTEKLLTTRNAKSLGQVTLIGRPGIKTSLKVGGDTLKSVEIESEMHTHLVYDELNRVIESRLNIKAAIQLGENTHTFHSVSGHSSFQDQPQYHELGRIIGQNETLVIKITSSFLFIDGTPARHDRLEENPRKRTTPPQPNADLFRMKNEDGSVYSMTRLPVDFLQLFTIRDQDEDEDDPFGEDLDENENDPTSKLPMIHLDSEKFYGHPLDRIYDVHTCFSDRGVKFRKADWAYYNRDTSMLWVRLPPEQQELIGALLESTGPDHLRHLKLSLTRIESTQKPTLELLDQNSFTPKILNRVVHHSRPGALGSLDQTLGKLTHEFTCEPNIGANPRIIEARLDFLTTENEKITFDYTSGLVLYSNQSKIIPLKKENGKWQSLIIEGKVIETSFR